MSLGDFCYISYCRTFLRLLWTVYVYVVCGQNMLIYTKNFIIKYVLLEYVRGFACMELWNCLKGLYVVCTM